MNLENHDTSESRHKSIIRKVHNRENPFVMLNKSALWDPRLSLRAVGLWSRCMSRPDSWHFNMKELIAHCQEGKTAIYSIMKELEDAGYLMRIDIKERHTDGSFSGCKLEYIFFEFPATQEDKDKQLEEYKARYRIPENPETGHNACEGTHRDSGLRNPGDRELLIYKSSDKKSYKKKEKDREDISESPADASDSPPPVPSSASKEEKLSYGAHNMVRLTKKEFDNLLEHMTVQERYQLIQDIDVARGNDPSTFDKKYKSHYFTILKWHNLNKKRQQQTTPAKYVPEPEPEFEPDPDLAAAIKRRDAKRNGGDNA